MLIKILKRGGYKKGGKALTEKCQLLNINRLIELENLFVITKTTEKENIVIGY